MKVITIQHYDNGWYTQTYAVNSGGTHYYDNSYGVWVRLCLDNQSKVKELV